MIKDGRHYSKEDIILISESAMGKSLEEIMTSKLIKIGEDRNKGGLGQLIEYYLFDMENNSESEPDFLDAGIELKVTPYKRIQNNQLSAKERLVLNIIDYNTEFANEFKASHFWYKNNKIQILWYLWTEDGNKYTYKFTNHKLLDLAISDDLKQIESDWNDIIKKIKDGKAHEISEADTMYLGACTKGANANSVRTQPFSDIKAKQRAFCFKTSYMTQLVRKYIGDYSNVEKIISDKSKTFIDYVNDVINKYKGRTQKELLNMFNLDSKAKSINSMLVSRMFNITGNIGETEEFLKANIIPRTIRIEENGRIKESMPFPTFKYKEIINQTWEESDLRNSLEETKYMFFVFKMIDGEYVFKGIKLWNMPEIEIDNEVKQVWIKTVELIKNGNIVKSIDSNGTRSTYFPGMSENPICHVRPHAANSEDTYELPISDKYTGLTEYTKHCFWINSKYLENTLKEFN